MFMRAALALAFFVSILPAGTAQNASPSAPLSDDQLIEILRTQQHSREIQRGARPVCEPQTHRGFLVFRDTHNCDQVSGETIIVQDEPASHAQPSEHPRVQLTYYDPVSPVIDHQGRRTQSIRYERDRLSDQRALNALHHEIRRSARRVCDTGSLSGVAANREERACIDNAVEHAMAQIEDN